MGNLRAGIGGKIMIAGDGDREWKEWREWWRKAELERAEMNAKVEMLSALWPDADVGRKVRGGGRKGADVIRGGRQVSDEQLTEAFDRLRDEHPTMKRTPLCELLSNEYRGVRGTSAKQLGRRLKELSR